MAIVPSQRTPVLTPKLKEQPQESPLAQFGRYGLYRQLLQTQIPRLQRAGLSSGLDLPLTQLVRRGLI